MARSTLASRVLVKGQSPDAAAAIESAAQENDSFLADVIAGLQKTPKQLQPKYFYDRQGSDYFDQICELEEYYPFRSELSLLPRVAREVAPLLDQHYALIEFGAGSLQKVQPLLDHVSGIRSFTPIDISGQHLHTACELLQLQYPRLQVQPVVADFTRPVELPASDHQRLGFFPGSTIGNFSPAEAKKFLANAAKTLGQAAYMLIGVDTKKDPAILHQAYNDAEGVTARFNLNILERINRELGADFDLDKFNHYAFYNPHHGRIEMHLLSTCRQSVRIGDVRLGFNKGESIHTECSYKYSPEEFQSLAADAGWSVREQWLAEGDMFATYLMQVA